ncbi:hypothetical protein HZC00_04345 [Candidatus Kaiserbacteria bacterium]|nr:hypothetical protein [Candidatus Kaiserbacteria bacterium]
MAEKKPKKPEKTALQKKLGFGSTSWLDFDAWVQWFWGWGIPRPLFLTVLFLGLLSILSTEIPHLFVFALGWIFGTAPVWLPFVLLIASYQTWVRYIRSDWISGRDPVLLEIHVPREVFKSPRAIETALGALWQTSGETDFIKRVWVGRVRPWFSLEIASFGGEIHFYIWTWGLYRNVAEAAIYSQFPDAEIHAVEDYASKLQYDPARYDGFVNDYKLVADDVYPISSYIDAELDKDPKEEFKVDPLAYMFEYLSGLKPHEQVWVQITLRSSKASGGIFFPNDTAKEWQARVEKEIENIRKQGIPEDERESTVRIPNPTWKQKQQMEAIERHSGKNTFDVCARGIYLVDTTKGHVHGSNIGTLRFLWKPLGTGYLNELAPDNTGGHNIFNYPWQDFQGMYKKFLLRRFLDAYRRRSSFYPPWTAEINVMSVEAIATLWHFPSSGIASPGISRIPAKKAAPPPNLPM